MPPQQFWNSFASLTVFLSGSDHYVKSYQGGKHSTDCCGSLGWQALAKGAADPQNDQNLVDFRMEILNRV
ncbi:MAG: hypothetical protein AAF808_15510, partial [Cyanobacteria bacterium P01_D01_bin.2]